MKIAPVTDLIFERFPELRQINRRGFIQEGRVRPAAPSEIARTRLFVAGIAASERAIDRPEPGESVGEF